MTIPSGKDVSVVQERLADLYAELTPAQQSVLDLILAAGISVADIGEDTGGFGMLDSPYTLDSYMRHHVADLHESNREAKQHGLGKASEGGAPRWDLRHLVEWFNRPRPQLKSSLTPPPTT